MPGDGSRGANMDFGHLAGYSRYPDPYPSTIMLAAIIALILLGAAVGAIYVLLRNMGQDGIEVAAPGSCKSGRCGVRKGAGAEAGCQREDDSFVDPADIPPLLADDHLPANPERPQQRLG